MADELTVTTGWAYSKNGRDRQLIGTANQYDVSGNPVLENVQSIGFATHEAIEVGEVATPGFFYAKNLDDENFVEIGIDDSGSFVPFVKLLPGETAQLFLSAITLYAQADTGAVLLDYAIMSR